MNYEIGAMTKEDWEEVAKIYLEGISTGKATFQSDIPTWENWNNGHI